MSDDRGASRRTSDYRIDPFDLRLFASVLEGGTITAAARAMNLSVGAASERLKTLEDRVGARLLERTRRGTVPSEAGRSFARHARRVLSELESLHVAVAGFGRGTSGVVRLMCNTAAMAEALPARLGRFLRRHPDIDVELQELSSESILDALRRGAADAGVVADHVDTTGLVAHPWLTDQLVAVVPRGVRMHGRRGIRFADLLAQPFVGLPSDRGLSRFLLQQALRTGRPPHHRVRVSSFDAAAQLVAQGVGVAVMPRSAAERWTSADAKVVLLNETWASRQLLICTAGPATERRSVRVLLEALLNDSDGGRSTG